MKVDIAPGKASVDAIIVRCSFVYSHSRTDFLTITSDSTLTTTEDLALLVRMASEETIGH